MMDGCAGRGNESFGLLDRRNDRCGSGVANGSLIAVHLLGGEDRRGARARARHPSNENARAAATQHSRHCFGKTLMQTSRGVAHVAHEKSLRECDAPGARTR
jgi:hypothetical protein